MPLESATYISDLNASNPIGATDPLSSADDHLRLLKATIKASFPGVTGAVNATHTQLNVLATDGAGAGMLADIAAIADPNVDRILFWDDSAGSVAALAPSTGLAITGTNLALSSTAGILEDFAVLADPGADRIFGWDESADAAIGFTLSTGLTTSGVNLLIDTSVVPQLAANNAYTPAAGGAQFAVYNSTNASGPYATFQRSGTSFGDIGDGKQLGAGFTQDAMALGARATYVIEMSAGGSTTPHFQIGTTGNFDFKGGVVTTNKASAQEVGTLGAVSSAKTADYTIVAADAEKMIRATSACDEIIINNSSEIPVGCGLIIVNELGGNVTITQGTGVTLYLTGAGGVAGSRTIASSGMATILKVSAGVYLVQGPGVS